MINGLIEAERHSTPLHLSTYLAAIKDLMIPDRRLIVLDLLCSTSIFHALLLLATWSESWFSFSVFSILAGLAFFRCLVFMHESFHMRDSFPILTVLYDAFFGVLQKMPSFIYFPHTYHHQQSTYGTKLDPEYAAVTKESPAKLLLIPFIFVPIPAIQFLRHGILPALMPIMPTAWRNKIYSRFSTFAMNLNYLRPDPNDRERKAMIQQEAGTLLSTLAVTGLCYSGVLPWRYFLAWYVAYFVFYLTNYYRVLVSHRYFGSEKSFTFKEQILDSLTIPKMNAFYRLFFPLGLQFHTLHHMFPTVPYHNLPKIHRRLISLLPTTHPYRLSQRKNYWSAIGELIVIMRSGVRPLPLAQTNATRPETPRDLEAQL